jgi:hypothetical protein
VGGRQNGGLDLAAAEAAQVTPYSYAPAGPPAQMTQQNVSSVFGPGAAGVGAAGIAASSRHGPPTSAPSAYSQPTQTQSQYGGTSSSEAGGMSAAHQSYQQHSMYSGGHDYAAYADGADGMSEAGMSSPRSGTFAGGAGGFYVPPVGNWRGPSPGPSLPNTATTGTLPSQKEMEAQGLRVRNRHSNPHLDSDDSGAVLQHTDGGRIGGREDESVTPPREVPPSYDSIRD